MHDRGFTCGIEWTEKDGTKRACTHESRRAALACTRRLMVVGCANELEIARNKIVELETGLTNKEAKLQELEIQLTDKDSTIKTLEASLKEKEAKVQELEAKIEEATAGIEELKDTIADKCSRIQELEAYIQTDIRNTIETRVAEAKA